MCSFFLKLYSFSSSFWFSGWAACPPGKALATPLCKSVLILCVQKYLGWAIEHFRRHFFYPPSQIAKLFNTPQQKKNNNNNNNNFFPPLAVLLNSSAPRLGTNQHDALGVQSVTLKLISYPYPSWTNLRFSSSHGVCEEDAPLPPQLAGKFYVFETDFVNFVKIW